MPKFLEVSDAVAARSAINAAGGNTVYVEDYRDGVRTDNEIIAAAFAELESGSVLKFGEGVTYSLASTLDFSFELNNVVIDGGGAVLDASSAASDTRVLRIQGSKKTATGVTSLTSAVTERTKTLTVASTATYQPGDLVYIYSDGEVFNFDGADPPNNFKQEIGKVASVTDSTTLVLEERTWNTYSLSGYSVSVIRGVPARHLTVRDLTIVGSGDTGGDQYGLWIRYFDGLLVENVKVSGIQDAGILINEGINAVVRDCYLEEINATSGGNGVYVLECHNVDVVNCRMVGCRHAFDADRTRDVRVTGCSAEGTGASAFTTHGNCDVAVFENCTAYECGGGIHVRGRNTIVRGNRVVGSKLPAEQPIAQTYIHGIMVGHDTPNLFGNGNGGIDLTIDNNVVDISGPDYSTRTDKIASGIYATARLINARITNNLLRGFSFHGIYCKGEGGDTVEISGNFIDCSDQLAGQSGSGIRLDPTSTENASKFSNLTIRGNSITDTTHSGIWVSGGPSASHVSDVVAIADNRIGSAGTAPIYLDDGYYGSDVIITGNRTADNTAVELTIANWDVPPYIGSHGYDRQARVIGVGQEFGSRMRPGWWYCPAGETATGTTTLDRLLAVAIFVPRRVAVDRIGINVTTASGSAGSEARLGIYADAEDGYGGLPGDLVSGSTGSVATDATGFVSATINATLNPGLYWLATVTQTATCSVTVMTGNNQVTGHNSATVMNNRHGYRQDSVGGELPATFASIAAQGACPFVQIRVAAASTL